jgi:hypothetical protein
MHLNHTVVYVSATIAIELLFCFLILIFSTGDNWFGQQSRNNNSKSRGNCVDLSHLPEEKISLFKSKSTTQKWSSEYAIIVIFQYNRVTTTRIIDMSFLECDTKQLFRKYENEFLRLSLSASGASTAVKVDSEAIQDSHRVASVIPQLLNKDVNTDLHKIPLNGVRILHLIVQYY